RKGPRERSPKAWSSPTGERRLSDQLADRNDGVGGLDRVRDLGFALGHHAGHLGADVRVERLQQHLLAVRQEPHGVLMGVALVRGAFYEHAVLDRDDPEGGLYRLGKARQDKRGAWQDAAGDLRVDLVAVDGLADETQGAAREAVQGQVLIGLGGTRAI